MGKKAVSFVKISRDRGHGDDVHKVIGGVGGNDLLLKNVRTGGQVRISASLTYKDGECLTALQRYRQSIGT